MVAGRPKLGTFLISRGIITDEQLDAAIGHQVAQGCRLGEALFELELCSEAQIGLALAEQLEVPFVDLEETPPSAACVVLLPREVALEYGVLPIRMQGNRLLVAALDPYDIRVDEAIRLVTGLQPILAMAAKTQLQEHLQRNYGDIFLEETSAGRKEDLEDLEAGDAQHVSLERLVAAGEQVSTIRVVNTLIADAVRRGASDLHIEPEPGRVRVRCRIDGRMCVVASLPGDLLQSVVARVKIMAGMDISENRKPQQGEDVRHGR